MPGLGIGPFRIGISYKGNTYVRGPGFRSSSYSKSGYRSPSYKIGTGRVYSTRQRDSEIYNKCKALTQQGTRCSFLGRYQGYCKKHLEIEMRRREERKREVLHQIQRYIYSVNIENPDPRTIAIISNLYSSIDEESQSFGYAKHMIDFLKNSPSIESREIDSCLTRYVEHHFTKADRMREGKKYNQAIKALSYLLDDIKAINRFNDCVMWIYKTKGRIKEISVERKNEIKRLNIEVSTSENRLESFTNLNIIVIISFLVVLIVNLLSIYITPVTILLLILILYIYSESNKVEEEIKGRKADLMTIQRS